MKYWMLRLYAPLFLLGFVGTAAWWVGYRHGDILWLLPLLGLAVLLSFLAECCWPYDPRFNQDHDDRGRDALPALVNEGLNLLSISLVPLLAAWVPWQCWPTQWPFAVQLLLAFTKGDCSQA